MTRPLEPELAEFLALESRAVAPLALALRELVLEQAPGCLERIFGNHPAALWFGHGPRMEDMFCYVAMATRHVNLGFCRGAFMDDPHGVLEGTGKVMRHIKVRSREDLERPFLAAYVRAAAA